MIRFSLGGLRAVCGLNDPGEGRVDLFQLGEELLENGAALTRKAVKALLAIIFLAPLAFQKALVFKSAEQRIKRAFVHLDPERGEILAQGVTVVFLAQLGEDGNGEKPAPQLEAQVIKKVGMQIGFHYHV